MIFISANGYDCLNAFGMDSLAIGLHLNKYAIIFKFDKATILIITVSYTLNYHNYTKSYILNVIF